MNQNLHGQVIQYTEVNKFPIRDDFVDGAQGINHKLRNTEELNFLPNDVLELKENWKYKLYLFGVLENGAKTTVIIDNILLYFDVKVTGTNIEKFRLGIKSYLLNEKINIISTEVVYQFPAKIFHENQIPYLRIKFKNQIDYKNALKLLNKENYELANDDTGNFYRKIARENKLHLCQWLKINKYITDNEIKLNCRYVLRTTINNIKVVKDPTHLIKNEKLLVQTWDIETWSPDQGILPHWTRKKDKIKIIGTTFNWRCNADSFLNIALTTCPSAPVKNTLIIECPDEPTLIKTWRVLFQRMMPDMLIGFNDGLYDTPFLMNRAIEDGQIREMYDMMSVVALENWMKTDSLKRYNYREEIVKISAELSVSQYVFKIPGFIPIDVRTWMRKIFKKDEKSSLNYYLAKLGMDLKVDMPYRRMAEILSGAGSPEEVGEVIYYCIIDAHRCNELMHMKKFVDDAKQMGCFSYVSMYDALYRADSMKVTNMMMSYGFDRNIAYSRSNWKKQPKAEYPGGYVFDPIKGLYRDVPVVGLDFASLYPSLIRAYNISYEMLVLDENHADKLRKKGYNLHYIEFPSGNGTLRCWMVRHDNDRQKFGIIPTIVDELFYERKKIKKEMLVHNKQLEILAKKKADGDDVDESYEQHRLAQESLDIRQKAVKVFMNTFYGVMGTPNFFLYEPAMAGMITLSGQYNIKLAKKYAENQQCIIKYGDTDSLYISPPNSLFAEHIQQFEEGKITLEGLCTQKVLLTKEFVQKVQDGINKMLQEDNGTEFLTMAYEEVLFPVLLLGKKKYAAIAHEDIVNFQPTKYFLRGLEHIKQGRSKLLIEISDEIIKEALDIYSTKPMLEIVEEKIRKIYKTDWPIDYFVANATYKPDKENIPVKKFVRRMELRKMQDPQVEVPLPGEKFQYVVIHRDIQYDISGKIIVCQKGDKMEYVDTAQKEGWKIDLHHYMTGSIIGAFARFICYDDRFLYDEIEGAQDGEPKNKKLDDEANVKKAKKHLNNFIKNFFNTNSKKVGTIYKAIYRDTIKQVDEYFGGINVEKKMAKAILPINIEFENSNEYFSYIVEFAQSLGREQTFDKTFLRKYTKHSNMRTLNDCMIFPRKKMAYVDYQIQYLKKYEKEALKNLKKIIDENVYQKYSDFRQTLVEYVIKSRIDISKLVLSIDNKSVWELGFAFLKLVSVYNMREFYNMRSQGIRDARSGGIYSNAMKEFSL